MKYKLLKNEEILSEQCLSYINNHPYGTIFHTPYMFEVYKETPNYEPFAYYAVDEQRQIKAMLSGVIQTVKPGFLSSLSKRAVMMQAPIFDEIEALDFLLSEYSKLMKHKVVYTEVRNHYDPECMSRTMLKNGFKYEDHLNIIVDLSQDEDVIFSQINSTRRKQIKRGYKRGVQSHIEYGSNMEIVGKCYELIHSLYKRLGLPYPEKNHIESAFNLANKNTYPVCFYLKYNEQIIGTRMVLCYKKCIYDWYAASLENYYDKYPNDILPWEVFQWGHQNEFSIFDFGGAGKPNVPYGVRDYKMKFGGKLVNYGRFTLVHNPIKMKLAETGFKIYKKAKLL